MTHDYDMVKGEQELWRGRQWAVTTYCIHGLGDWNYYHIPLDRLRKERTKKHSWLDHMAGKRNIDIDDFTQAFLIACVYCGITLKDIGERIDRAKTTNEDNIKEQRRLKDEALAMGYAPGEPFLYQFGKNGEIQLVPKINSKE
jgi:hypothetical protein